MPKDEDAFDQFGYRLFRDAYRIRSEDTFDLRYLTENQSLQKLQKVADRIVQDHRKYNQIYPYNKFSLGSVPGEDALVRRQIYEVLKRQQASEVLDAEKLIFFKPDDDVGSGFKVQFLSQIFRRKSSLCFNQKKGMVGPLAYVSV